VIAEVTACCVLNTKLIPVLKGQDVDVSKRSLKLLDTSKYVILLICEMETALQNQMEVSVLAP